MNIAYWNINTGTSKVNYIYTWHSDELQRQSMRETISTTYVHLRHTTATNTGRFGSWYAHCMSQAPCKVKFAANKKAHSCD